jgi:3-isopropylmalate/(R)-2-methylmalate dehydratase large subunit
MQSRTLFEKIWDEHVVAQLGEGFELIHVDRHLIHDLGARGFVTLQRRKLAVRNPELTFATSDHTVSTERMLPAGRSRDNDFIANLRDSAGRHGFHFFEPESADHGIVHVVTPELGLALPGMTLACGDSHSCTIGALGAIAWGIGQSELVHVLATQSSVQRRPRQMRIRFHGTPSRWVTPKDVVMALIGRFGVAGGSGFAVEFAGPYIESLPMEGRLTLCNMSVEFGARFGFIAPDNVTVDYLYGRRYAPAGDEWERAVRHWHALASDADATFDREEVFDVSQVEPQVSWGTSPEHVVAIGGRVPDPAGEPDPVRRDAFAAALAYGGLQAGEAIEGTPLDMVFIGSCTNSRISDLRIAAELVRGHHVAHGLRAWVVPGSKAVMREAESEGLDRVFSEAGFEWRLPGCSMCGGTGGLMTERERPGRRVLSTSNRNFVGRQGPGSRTLLASPATAAASAITGRVTDVRKWAGA